MSRGLGDVYKRQGVEAKDLDDVKVWALWSSGSRFEAGEAYQRHVGADATFRLTGLPHDRPVRVIAQAGPASGLVWVPVRARAGDASIRLPRRPGLTIEGRLDPVLVQDRKAAWVRAIRAGFPPIVAHAGQVDVEADGTFRLTGLDAGDHYLVVGAVPEEAGLAAVHGPVLAGTSGVEIEAPILAELRGSVVGGDSTVSCWEETATCYVGWTLPVGGDFTFRVPADRAYTLVAEGGDKAAVITGVAPGSDAVTLRPAPSETLQAQLEGFDGPVLAVAILGGSRRSHWVSAGGHVRFASVPAGVYDLVLLTREAFYARRAGAWSDDMRESVEAQVRTGPLSVRVRHP